MQVILTITFSLLFFLQPLQAVNLHDIYAKLIEREKGHGVQFTDMFIRPIAVIDGEIVSF